MTESKIERGEHWRTRAGNEVRILATDADGERPIVGQIAGTRGVFVWCANGGWRDNHSEHVNDLVELLPEEHVYERWANIYPDNFATNYLTRGDADAFAGEHRIACLHIKIPYRAGDGLNDGGV
jgi:hypothetical protein